MDLKKILGAAAIMACTISGGRALAQASINENQSSYIYVNAATGSDVNPGTSNKPTHTIQAALTKAVAAAKAGIGTKVMIAPGTYHELLTVNSSASVVPITVQASTAGTAVIDAADVLTNWHKAGANVYAYTWKDSVTGCSLPSGWYTGMPPVVLANEMVFVDGNLMTQVMSSSQLRAGTFYVNGSSEQVEVDPPSGTDMTSATVEISARRSTLDVYKSKNLVFRGLTFQHAAACMNTTGATVTSSSNILFDNDKAEWNNWGGLGVTGSTDVTVENTTGSNNGGPGLAGYMDVNSSWVNNETDYNNWRGSMVGLYDFAQGGTKLMLQHGATVTGQKSYYNASQGLWFDTDNENITVNGGKLVGNLVGNLQLEASQGPITVENTTFCSGGGLQVLTSDGITLTNNVFYNNGGQSFQNGQLFLGGNPDGRSFTNWQTHKSMTLFSNNMKLHGNDFVAVGPGQNVFSTYVTGTHWTEFKDTLTSNDNHWYNASKTAAFVTPSGSTTLSGWQGQTGQDKGSEWVSASASCGSAAATYADFQLLAHNAASYISSYAMSGGKVHIPLQVRSFNYGTVQLSVSGLPAGVTASFSPGSLASGSSVLNLTASSSASTETVPITIFGVSGNRVHAITVKVSVKKP